MITVGSRRQFRKDISKPDSPSESLSLEHLLAYLCVPLNFTFLFFCSPFRLTRNSKMISGDYHARRYWLHSLLCMFLSFVDVLWMIAYIRRSMIKIPRGNLNPALYIELFNTVISQASKISLLKKLWLGSQDFANLANVISTKFQYRRFPPFTPKWYRGKCIVCALSILYTLVGILNIAAPDRLGNSLGGKRNSETWWSIVVHGGRKVFFIDDISTSANYSGFDYKNLNTSSLDLLVGVISSVGLLHRYEHGNITNLYKYVFPGIAILINYSCNYLVILLSICAIADAWWGYTVSYWFS